MHIVDFDSKQSNTLSETPRRPQSGESHLSRVQVVLASMVLKPPSIPMPTEIGYSLGRGRGGSLDCTWGVQTHSRPLVFLVLFRKEPARMNGTPHPNRK